MKLTIKTLQQFNFKLDIDENKTVKELKEQIERDHGKDYPIANQKLIYSGKILADESKLSEYNVDEKKFIVLMITRPPPPPKVQPPADKASTSTTSSSSSASASASASTATTATAKKEDTKPKVKSEDKRLPKSTNSATTTSTSSTTANQSPVTPASASNNPSTPTNLSTTTTTADSNLQNAPRRPMAAGGRTSQAGSDQAYMSSTLSSIMSQPQIRQLQQLIQQSPHLISPTIESLASTDPEMYSFISENPDIFVNALNQTPMSLNLSPSSRGSTTGSGAGQQQQQQAEQGIRDLQQGVRNMASGGRPGTVEVPNVSEHDKEAIERLKELGFSEIQAYQAYFACDKDEQLAANLLFQMEQ